MNFEAPPSIIHLFHCEVKSAFFAVWKHFEMDISQSGLNLEYKQPLTWYKIFIFNQLCQLQFSIKRFEQADIL